jgi:hypothetical protein
VTRLTLPQLRHTLDMYLSGLQPFSAVRRFVYGYYEAEDESALDASLTEIFPILAPYLEDEEARGDDGRQERIRRLRDLLDRDTALPERVVFALEFDKIRDLGRRFNNKLISRDTLENEIQKLSPGRFDWRRVALWAISHHGENEPDPSKMS